MLYFAFGSNMSRARLRRRVGPAADLGRAVLEGYRHRFNKLGRDGTGKGNVEPAPGAIVHGVLYELAPEQLELLGVFEGGYQRTELSVTLPDGTEKMATTFVGIRPTHDLAPSPEYLEHYRVGLEEHAIPAAYADELLDGIESSQ